MALKPAQDEYDFVIVGGGTAGLVVAARLTENPGELVCFPRKVICKPYKPIQTLACNLCMWSYTLPSVNIL